MARSEFSKISAGGFGAMLLVVATSVGCQSDYAGQTLPSPYWQKDDIQYFPPGPEFKLSREAAAMKTYGTGRASRPAAGAQRRQLKPGHAPAVISISRLVRSELLQVRMLPAADQRWARRRRDAAGRTAGR